MAERGIRSGGTQSGCQPAVERREAAAGFTDGRASTRTLTLAPRRAALSSACSTLGRSVYASTLIRRPQAIARSTCSTELNATTSAAITTRGFYA